MTVEQYFHTLWRFPALDEIAALLADYGLYVCIAALALAWLIRKPRRLVMPFLAGAVAATLADVIAGASLHDLRPFVALHVQPLVAHSADNGFPSDHSVVAAYASTMAAFIDPAIGAVAWIAALALGVGRVFSLLHTPLDVLGGWLIGVVPALIVGCVWRRGSKSGDRGGRA